MEKRDQQERELQKQANMIKRLEDQQKALEAQKNKKRKKPKLPIKEVLPENYILSSKPEVPVPSPIITTRAVDFMP